MNDKTISVGGLPVHVVEDEEAEKCDYLICVPAECDTPFTDNLTAFCCECGRKVQHRWHAPRKPKRICMECVVKLEERNAQTKDKAQADR